MNEKVLIAFATTHGSTQEIAMRAAGQIRQAGMQVDVKPARQLCSLDGYQAVVLGFSIYMFHMHGDARRFLNRHQQALAAGLPLAIFAGGPIGTGNADEWSDVRKRLDAELAKYAWLKPAALELVGGRFDPNKLRFPWSLIPALHSTPANDLRDWDAIERWTASLPVTFSRTARTNQAAEGIVR